MSVSRRRKSSELSLTSTIREAIERSPGLAAQARVVGAGRERVREARAGLLPQLEASATYAVIDDALGSPQQAERQADGALEVTQVIYADGARAGLQIERHLQSAREAAMARTRLEVIQEAARPI